MAEHESTSTTEDTTVSTDQAVDAEDTITADDMAEFMNEYVDRIKAEGRKRFMDEIDHIVDTCGTLPDFSKFAHHSRNYSSNAKYAVTEYLADENSVDRTSNYLFAGEYIHYDFIRANMRALITKYEGSSCCMDKCSALMRLLQRSVLEGENFTLPETGEWYLPARRLDLWVNMVVGLIRLSAGENDVYLRTLVELEKEYQQH